MKDQITFGEILRTGTLTEIVDSTLDLLATVDQLETDPRCRQHNMHQILETAFVEMMQRGSDTERYRFTEYLADYLKQSNALRQSGDLIIVAPSAEQLN
jgi:hypothetical protein